MLARQSHHLAQAKKPFDLFVSTANSLDATVLVDRTGDGEVLADRHVAQRREQSVELGAAGAVTVDTRVGLLETDTCRHRQRMLLAKAGAEEAAQDHPPLVVRRA